MFEIELKAHVHDKNALIKRLAVFARHTKTVEKNDIYYHLPLSNEQDHLTVRIRSEIQFSDGKKTEKNYITYKKKQIRSNNEGQESEINDEKECTVSDTEPLKTLLEDIGFSTALRKQKFVEDYEVGTEFGTATIEICTVAKLGDFVEIEILSETDDSPTVSSIQKKLHSLLDDCGIPRSDIENRYYSELLAQTEKTEAENKQHKGGSFDYV